MNAREGFAWPVAVGGYTWREDMKWAEPKSIVGGHPYQSPPFLVARPGVTRRRRIAILEDGQDSFLEFARLAGPNGSEQRKEIRRFADHYGFLIGGRWIAPEGGGKFEPGESLRFWRREIQHMAWAAQVLGALEGGDAEFLRRVIWWQKDRVGFILVNLSREELLLRFRNAEDVFQFVRNEHRRAIKGGTPEERHRALFSAGWLAGSGKRDRMFQHIPWGDLRRPALLLLADFIAKKLAEYPVALRIGMDIEKNELRSFPMPANLLSAMWLLLYQAVKGEITIKRCDICHEWGVAKTKRWKAHKDCAHAKRQREYRKNKRERR